MPRTNKVDYVVGRPTEEISTVFILAAIVIFSFALQVFLRYNLGASNRHYYDIIYVAPGGLLMVILWYIFITLSISVNCEHSRKSLYLVMFTLLSIMPYLMEIATNPQSILARDVYLHGHVRFLDSTGKLDELGHVYPKQYPGFFVLWYTTYVLVGYPDIRHVNLLILHPVMMLTFVLILLILYKLFFKRLSSSLVLSIVVTLSLLMNHRSELTFQHANTRLYSLILLMLSLLLVLISARKSISRPLALLLLTSLALSISHVLYPLINMVALIMFLMISALKRERGGVSKYRAILLVAITITLIYFSWTFYNYYSLSMAVTGIRTFFDYYYRTLGRELLTASLTVREALPWFGVIQRNVFKFLLIFLTFTAGIFIAKNLLSKKITGLETNTTMTIWASYVGATTIVFGLTVFTASLGNSINRGLMVFIPLITPCAIAQLLELSLKKNVKKNIIKTLTLLAVIFLNLNQFMLLHEGPVIVSNTQPLDAVCSFLAEFNTSVNILITSTPFLIYYTYHVPELPPYRYISDIGQVETIHEVSKFYLQSHGVKIIDFRTIIYWSLRYEDYHTGLKEWMEFVLEPLSVSDSLIYNDNGNTWVFIVPIS